MYAELPFSSSTLLKTILCQAVEVASSKSLYELVIKTEIGNGTAVPRGRVNLPREAKPRGEDKVLVFAEGRLADEARKAGAHIIGGPELIEGVGAALCGFSGSPD